MLLPLKQLSFIELSKILLTIETFKYVWKSFLAQEILGDSLVSYLPESPFKSTIL